MVLIEEVLYSKYLYFECYHSGKIHCKALINSEIWFHYHMDLSTRVQILYLVK